MAQTKTTASKVAGTPRPRKSRPARPRLPKALSCAVRAAQDKKAIDMVVLDLRKADGFTDYFLICTGANPRQIGALADGIEETLRKEVGERPALVEGRRESEWVLLDYFNFVVHVFSKKCRGFYDLERLWGNAKRHQIGDEEPTS